MRTRYFTAILSPLACIVASLVGLPLGQGEEALFNKLVTLTASNIAVSATDADDDGDVDLRDIAKFETCFTGSISAPDFQAPSDPLCLPVFDSNMDGAIDLADLEPIESLFRGPGVHVVGPLFLENQFLVIKTEAPLFVTTVDLDGEGNLDLIVGNDCCGDFPVESSYSISILLNNNDGTFSRGMNFDVATADSITTGDLDGDGDQDIATPSSVLLNNGDGTFAEPVDLVTGDFPRSVAIGDLNNDGHLDLAVAYFLNECTGSGDDGGLSILFNHGNGTFAEAMNFNTGLCPVSVAMIDLFFGFDGEMAGFGDLDLVVVAEDSFDSISFLFNDNETFLLIDSQSLFSCCSFNSSKFIRTGDMNGDGAPDLVVVDNNGVHVILNRLQENISFIGGDFIHTYPELRSFGIGDLDGDGDIDLAVANAVGANHGELNMGYVSILLNNGDGRFTALVDLYGGDDPVSIDMGDVDGDGDLDLVVANHFSDDVYIFLNQRFR